MRENKFRYVLTDTDGEQIYYRDPYDVYMTIEGELYTSDHDQLNAKLIQYTGLKDKIGVEIYEGDIISYKSPVVENTNRFLVCEWLEEDGAFVFGGIKTNYAIRYGEVIGNIYENHELLKEAQT